MLPKEPEINNSSINALDESNSEEGGSYNSEENSDIESGSSSCSEDNSDVSSGICGSECRVEELDSEENCASVEDNKSVQNVNKSVKQKKGKIAYRGGNFGKPKQSRKNKVSAKHQGEEATLEPIQTVNDIEDNKVRGEVSSTTSANVRGDEALNAEPIDPDSIKVVDVVLPHPSVKKIADEVRKEIVRDIKTYIYSVDCSEKDSYSKSLEDLINAYNVSTQDEPHPEDTIVADESYRVVGEATFKVVYSDKPVANPASYSLIEALQAGHKGVVSITPDETMDSGASRCCTGDRSQIVKEYEDLKGMFKNLRVEGYDGSTRSVDLVGLNRDGKIMLYIPAMGYRTLLSVYDYAQDGAVIFLDDKGYVVKLTPNQLSELEEWLSSKEIVKQLSVVNRIYKPINPISAFDPNAPIERAQSVQIATQIYRPDTGPAVDAQVEQGNVLYEFARSVTFFNSKLITSDREERIMCMLMMGFRLNDLILYVGRMRGAVKGIHPSITKTALKKFKAKFGTSPDAWTLARTHIDGNVKAFEGLHHPIKKVGDHVEFDICEPEMNQLSAEGPAKKVIAKGEGTCILVAVDAYSGMTRAIVLKSGAKSAMAVKQIMDEFERDGHHIAVLAADSGVISTRKYTVATTEAQEMMLLNKTKCHLSEPHNHSNGSARVERMIQELKLLMRVAYTYIFRNPNLKYSGFTRDDILSLWGEIVQWACHVINMRPCDKVEGKTRYEVYHGLPFNIQQHRMLPIFAFVMITRQKDADNPLYESNHTFRQYGLYLGPDSLVNGAIRVAVKFGDQLDVIVTTKYTGVSEGGGNNIYPIIQRALHKVLKDNGRNAPVHPKDNEEEKIEDEQFEVEPDVMDTNLEYAKYKKAIKAQKRKEKNMLKKARQEALLKKTSPKSSEEINAQTPGPVAKIETQKTHEPTASKSNDAKESTTGSHEPVDKDKEIDQTVKKPIRNKAMVYNPNASGRDRGSRAQRRQQLAELIANPNGISANLILEAKEEIEDINNGIQFDAMQEQIMKIKCWSALIKDTSIDYGERLAPKLVKNRPGEVVVANMVKTLNKGEQYYLYNREENLVFAFDMDEDKEKIAEAIRDLAEVTTIEEFKAVTVGTPKNYGQALVDPVWGTAALLEMNQLLETKAIVPISYEQYYELKNKEGADLVYLFPIYEEKIKNNMLVRKVRLVGDGRGQSDTATYSPTPNRETLLTLLHMAGVNDWDFMYFDEERAFLNAKYDKAADGRRKVVVTIRGMKKYWEVKGALYGLKTSPRDYNIETKERLTTIFGFSVSPFNPCLYFKRTDKGIIFHLAYVDDNLVIAPTIEMCREHYEAYNKVVKCPTMAENGGKFLGMLLKRDRATRTISVSMEECITEMYNVFFKDEKDYKPKYMPLAQNNYIVDENKLKPDKRKLVNKQKQHDYLSGVGRLQWIATLRFDILYSLLYLSWYTKAPKEHDFEQMKYCMSYLYNTKDVPLVVGGNEPIRIHAFTDASLGTGPKHKSVAGRMFTLGSESGAISAKTSASASVNLSSFECELDGVFEAEKSVARIINMFNEMPIETISQNLNPVLKSDNRVVVDFVNNDSDVKGAKHMERRLYYLKDLAERKVLKLEWMSGEDMPADKLTKAGTAVEHKKFAARILGLKLLGQNYVDQFLKQEKSDND